MRRFLYVGIIILVVILVVLTGYLLRYRGELPEKPGGGGGGLPAGELPPYGTGTLPLGGPVGGPLPPEFKAGSSFGVLTQAHFAHNYFVDSQSNVTLVAPDGQVVRVSGNQATTLSSTPIANLIRASFSYDGQKILALFGDQRLPQGSVFDLKTRAWQALSPGIQSPSWSPTDFRIAYFTLRDGRGVLETLDLAATTTAKAKEIIKMEQAGARVHWVLPTQMLFFEPPSASVPTSLLAFDVSRRTAAQIAKDRLGLTTLWDASFSRGIAFIANQNRRGGKLYLMDAGGAFLKELSFVTLPEKCAFHGTSFLYCAVPNNQELLGRTPLPDAYLTRSLFTRDSLYRTDLETGETVTILPGDEQVFDAALLTVAGGKIYFVNRLDRKLYVVSLPGE